MPARPWMPSAAANSINSAHQRGARAPAWKLAGLLVAGQAVADEAVEALVGLLEGSYSSAGSTQLAGEDDLRQELPPACDQVWKRRGEGWHGRVDPATCRIWSERRQAWRGIESEALVTRERYLTTERGFDAESNQVFGTAPGVYLVLDRR